MKERKALPLVFTLKLRVEQEEKFLYKASSVLEEEETVTAYGKSKFRAVGFLLREIGERFLHDNPVPRDT